MTNPFREFLNSIDAMSIAKKTTILFLIMVIGMLFIGSFAHLSINRIKHNFDVLYTKRMLPIIRLENLKDIYTVNVLDTIRDIEKGAITAKEGKVVILLAQELLALELLEYKNSLTINEDDWLWSLMKDLSFIPVSKTFHDNDAIDKIEKKMKTIDAILFKMFGLFDTEKTIEAYETLQDELYPSIYSINIDITGLVNLNLESAREGFSKTQNVYDNTFQWILIASLITIGFVALLALVLLRNIRFLHNRLAIAVDEKTKELQELNRSLEQKVAYEVEQSRQKDQIMFRQSRLASMGEMIGNIAHQWRQPLNAMVLVIQSFQMKRMAGLEIEDAFIEEQTKEGIALASMMSRTIDDFRNFFKPNRAQEEFGLQKSVLYSIELIREYYTKLGIDINLVCAEEIMVFGYPNEFSQVMMNLFSNAKDALLETTQESKKIEVLIQRDLEKATIAVVDNGGGISDEIKDRMFEPYFTTKHKSSGTGIGLYMSQQIIEKQMQGTIRAGTVKYRFEDGQDHEQCAMITIVIPLEKKEGKENEL